MGARITEVDEKSNGITEQSKGDRRRKTSKSSSSTTATRGDGGGNGGGSGGDTNTTEKQSKDISGLVVLDEQKTPKEEEKKDKPKQRKPRQVRKSKNNPKISSEQLTLILGGISTAIASRKGCEHWLLTEEETKSITEPLAKMIEESSLFENIGQYSNQIALVTACITIFTPRIFITVQKMREEKKKNGIIRQQPANTVRETQRSNNKTDKRNIEKSTANNGRNGANVSWYGDPIC